MTTETKVEAVAWLVTSGDARVICMSEATADAQAFELRKGGYPANVEKLIPASAITALEGEVAYYKENFQSCMAALNAINNAIIEADEEGRGFVPIHQLQAALTKESP